MKTLQPINAAILSTGIPPDVLKQMIDALRYNGFTHVKAIDKIPELKETITDERLDLHLPDELMDVRFLLLDEWIDGHSAFEVQAALKATAEADQLDFGILLSSPSHNSTILAAWAAGFELCLEKEDLDGLSNLPIADKLKLKADG